MKRLSYKIRQGNNFTEDIYQFYLVPKDDSVMFQPGQYVMLHLPNGIEAPFSMANHDPHALEFHLRYLPNNPISLAFYDYLQTHDSIEISGPMGTCTVANESLQQPILFIAGGTGISPHKSMIDALIKQDHKPDIYLYWGISRIEDDYMPDWFASCQQHIQATMILSQPSPSWQGPTGLVTDYVLANHPQLEAGISFASGPYDMIQVLKAAFVERNIIQQLRSDML